MADSGKQKRQTSRHNAIYTARLVDSLVCSKVRLQVCGSVRREHDTVGDVDLVVDNLEMFDKLLFLASLRSGIVSFERHGTIDDIKNRKKVDYSINDVLFNVYQAQKDAWGAMTLFLTGSKWFNIRMRQKAQSMGLRLNQYGLWRGHERIAAQTEEQIFVALNMKPVPPRERE